MSSADEVTQAILGVEWVNSTFLYANGVYVGRVLPSVVYDKKWICTYPASSTAARFRSLKQAKQYMLDYYVNHGG